MLISESRFRKLGDRYFGSLWGSLGKDSHTLNLTDTGSYAGRLYWFNMTLAHSMM